MGTLVLFLEKSSGDDDKCLLEPTFGKAFPELSCVRFWLLEDIKDGIGGLRSYRFLVFSCIIFI